ncbi:MAG: phosphoserine phosphatase SerB [Acidobacteriaceae bacterium]
MDDTFLISFSGGDQPGLISSLAEILDQHGARLLDVGQAVVHETLALGMLVRASSSTDTARLEKDLRSRAECLGLRVGFAPVSPDGFDHWANAQTKDRFVLTLLGREITGYHLFRVSAVVAESGLNIDRIERLSGRLSLATPAEDSYACLELHVSTDGPGESDALADRMRASLMALTHELTLDIAFQKECVFRRNRRLFVFDMDSTLIAGEVIDELAKLAGVGDQVSAITAAAMRGELDFQQSFRARVALLRGLPEERALAVLNSVPLVQGAERLISTLKRLGYKTAILSGGFNFFARDLQARLGVDYVFANDLDIADGIVTGEVKTPIVDAQRKADLLREIASRENISLSQVVAVGDGANDLPMLNIAGMGIAFHAKPLVRERAGNALSYLGLDSLLYLIGIRDRDLPGLADAATPMTDILCG